jgi:alanine racemase
MDGSGSEAAVLREARIDLRALRSNVAALRDQVAPVPVMAVVKADGYGHGAVPVARAAVESGAAWLGVVDLGEAFALRAAGVTVPILSWLHAPGEDFVSAVAAGIDLGITSARQLEAAAAVGGARVQFKLDTGLSRNGLAPSDAQPVFERAAELERAGRLLVRGIFSHLANASPDDDADQIALFEHLVTGARAAGLDPELRHLASTQAALTTPHARYDLVRVGIGLYGVSPAAGMDPAAYGLRPVMEVSGAVAAVRRVPAGAGVSYGFTHRVERETTLALIPLGYADGVPRSASGRGAVTIAGRRYPVVGRIAMDQFLVDVGDDPVVVGDRAVLWGDPTAGHLSADHWAEAAGTIGYEIVARLGSRVPRRFEG